MGAAHGPQERVRLPPVSRDAVLERRADGEAPTQAARRAVRSGVADGGGVPFGAAASAAIGCVSLTVDAEGDYVLTACCPRFNDFFITPPVLGAGPEALGFDGFFKGAYSYHYHNHWWTPFDPDRHYPDLGPRFVKAQSLSKDHPPEAMHDLSWSAVMKRTFEAYIRGERPNMYGEWLHW